MLTAIYNNGQSVANPQTAPAGSIEVHQVSGKFEIQFFGEVLTTVSDINEANQMASLISSAMPSPGGSI